MHISDDILNSVAFLSPDDNAPRNLGTGFTVGVPGFMVGGVPTGVFNVVFLYLVTAAQVARQIDGVPFLIGLNFRARQFGKSVIQTRDNYHWCYHPFEAETVDVAVTFMHASNSLNFDYIPISMLASDNLINIAPTSSRCLVDAIRLEARLTGREHQLALPIHGYIESATGDLDSYEVEMESDPGMPGTPVFVHHGAVLNLSPADARHRLEPSAVSLLGLLSETNNERENGRIASLVVPSKRILEVLNHPELVKPRDEANRRHKEWMNTVNALGWGRRP